MLFCIVTLNRVLSQLLQQNHEISFILKFNPKENPPAEAGGKSEVWLKYSFPDQLEVRARVNT